MRAACRILEGEVSRFFVELEPQSCKSCSGLNIVINKVKKDNEQKKKRGLGEPPHFEFVEKSRSCPNWSVGGCIFLRYTNETPIFRLRRTWLNWIISPPYPDVTLDTFGFPIGGRLAAEQAVSWPRLPKVALFGPKNVAGIFDFMHQLAIFCSTWNIFYSNSSPISILYFRLVLRGRREFWPRHFGPPQIWATANSANGNSGTWKLGWW